ncbi:LrgB family protein [Iodobacter fluviatilis]|uniref:Inner membrane protein yohK n=1 Tax=Iodobacter fluviatilis TaxID=537 RepID=A0A377SV65_9NEIS|nr:LrgB family protein [Iodobacter fluviatilis]TCU85098.1 putative murein hydrolase (TIGR00659 family) [Iodobacter fluviatilis]STR45218.1 Inner membrane protein yohK [Iodobacter fluviatilis]
MTLSVSTLAFICLVLTIVAYALAKFLYARHQRWWLAPLVLTPVLLVAFMLLTHTPYETYYSDTRWLLWLLGPATVAFAVPLYEYRALMVKHWLALSAGVIAGCFTALLSCVLLAKLFHLSPELTRSLLPRSISTPFALAVSDTWGGSHELTALFVVITGLMGMLFGELMLVLLPLRSRLARGALFGAAAHAVGTAKAREIGNEEGVVACITMMVSGVVMVLIAPLLTPLFA